MNTAQPPGPAKIPAEANGHPNTKHINDAIYAAAEQLQDRPHERRRIIFLISDGQNAKNNTHNYDDTLKLLLSADVSVYVVGVGEANLNRGITFLGNNILSKYAHATGGDIFYGGVSRENLEGFMRALPSRRATSTPSPIPDRKPINPSPTIRSKSA